jgi:hypothetical protein
MGKVSRSTFGFIWSTAFSKKALTTSFPWPTISMTISRETLLLTLRQQSAFAEARAVEGQPDANLECCLGTCRTSGIHNPR